jgi:hypothetical protein
MGAVRGKPGHTDGPALDNLHGVYGTDVLDEMPGPRVVSSMHGDRYRVVVDRDVRRPAQGPLDTERRSPATSEVIDDQLVFSQHQVHRFAPYAPGLGSLAAARGTAGHSRAAQSGHRKAWARSRKAAPQIEQFKLRSERDFIDVHVIQVVG